MKTRTAVEEFRRGLEFNLPMYSAPPAQDYHVKDEDTELTEEPQRLENAQDASTLAEAICMREAIAMSESASSSSAAAPAAEVPDTSNDAIIAFTVASDFTPAPRVTKAPDEDAQFGLVPIDFKEPKVEWPVQVAQNTPPLAWADVEDFWDKQRKRLNTNSPKTGVQIERLRNILLALRPESDLPPKKTHEGQVLGHHPRDLQRPFL